MRLRSVSRSVAVALAAMAATGAALLGSATPATAAPTTGPTVGGDLSWPQCGQAPALGDFGVVGVNAGTATSTNPCLATQLALAGASPAIGHAAVDVYLNTANPSPSAAAWWPTHDATRRGSAAHSPYGHCTGGATRACSWVYGASLAHDDLETRGVTGPVGRWWLDVEAANSWSASTTRNRAVLEGMTTALTAAHRSVGLYALAGEFHDFIGTVPTDSPIASLPSWIAGAGSQAGARRACSAAPLARGRVLLAQWIDSSAALDRDVACAPLTSTPKPKVTGSRVVHGLARAAVAHWGPGTVLQRYQWLRDGVPIASAVHTTYRLQTADSGHRFAVMVTGTRSGFSQAVRTSASIRAHR